MDPYTKLLIKDICKYATLYHEDSFSSWKEGKNHQEHMEETYVDEVMEILYREIGNIKEEKAKE